MSESEVVDRTLSPVTWAEIRDGLKQLGLLPGTTVLVHASLSALGWVAGSAHAVVLALVDAVGPTGTLVMPTFSNNLSDPARWSNPAVPEGWWESIRRDSPPFDPSLTPTRHMGAVVECFRHLPRVRRSGHPTRSFAGVGPKADDVVGSHEFANAFGETSPLARLYDMDAWVLLVGVGHANNTSLHLAEYRADYAEKVYVQQGSPVVIDGRRRWIEYTDLDGDSSDFEALGEAFAQTGCQLQAQIGAGTVRLMRQRQLVDFAVRWFEQHRQTTRAGGSTS